MSSEENSHRKIRGIVQMNSLLKTCLLGPRLRAASAGCGKGFEVGVGGLLEAGRLSLSAGRWPLVSALEGT